MVKLRYSYLLDNIDGILALKELLYLDMRFCFIVAHEDYYYKIDNISSLSQLAKLQYLYLDGNLISDLTWISDLKHLQDSDWKKVERDSSEA